MSKGIGKTYYEKFKDDMYPKDYVTINGRKERIPKYYDKILESEDIEEYEMIKHEREKTIDVHHVDNTTDRLWTIEKCTKKRLLEHKRDLEI